MIGEGLVADQEGRDAAVQLPLLGRGRPQLVVEGGGQIETVHVEHRLEQLLVILGRLLRTPVGERRSHHGGGHHESPPAQAQDQWRGRERYGSERQAQRRGDGDEVELFLDGLTELRCHGGVDTAVGAQHVDAVTAPGPLLHALEGVAEGCGHELAVVPGVFGTSAPGPFHDSAFSGQRPVEAGKLGEGRGFRREDGPGFFEGRRPVAEAPVPFHGEWADPPAQGTLRPVALQELDQGHFERPQQHPAQEDPHRREPERDEFVVGGEGIPQVHLPTGVVGVCSHENADRRDDDGAR